jgi:hypothetical protein
MIAYGTPGEPPIEVARIDRTEDGGTTRNLDQPIYGIRPISRMVHELRSVWSIREHGGQRVLRAARTERNAVTGLDGKLRWEVESLGSGDQAYGPTEFPLPNPDIFSWWCDRDWIAVMTDGPSVAELVGDHPRGTRVDLTRWLRLYLGSLRFQAGMPAIPEGHGQAVLLDVTPAGPGAEARWGVMFAGRVARGRVGMPSDHTVSFEGELVVQRGGALPA